MKKPISDAVILMAGSGSRLVAGGHVLPKPLIQIAGRAVFSYMIDALQQAGIETVHVVTGRNSDALLKGLEPLIPAEMKLHPIHNPEWQKQNGISVLAARLHVPAPFFF
jgi:choline kinase